jgi:hypothetical protein
MPVRDAIHNILWIWNVGNAVFVHSHGNFFCKHRSIVKATSVPRVSFSPPKDTISNNLSRIAEIVQTLATKNCMTFHFSSFQAAPIIQKDTAMLHN